MRWLTGTKVHHVQYRLDKGIYYYCSRCDHFFGKRRPLPDALCPDCESLYREIGAKLTSDGKKFPPPPSEWATLNGISWFLIFLLFCLLSFGACGILSSLAQIVASFGDRIVYWLASAGRVALPVVSLVLTTFVLFFAIRALIKLLSLGVFQLQEREYISVDIVKKKPKADELWGLPDMVL